MEIVKKKIEIISLPGQINKDLKLGDKNIIVEKINNFLSLTWWNFSFKHLKKIRGIVEKRTIWKNLTKLSFTKIIFKNNNKIMNIGEWFVPKVS